MPQNKKTQTDLKWGCIYREGTLNLSSACVYFLMQVISLGIDRFDVGVQPLVSKSLFTPRLLEFRKSKQAGLVQILFTLSLWFIASSADDVNNYCAIFTTIVAP